MSHIDRKKWLSFDGEEKIKANNLSELQRTLLLKINKELSHIERLLKKEFKLQNNIAQKRVLDVDDWPVDYEVEAYITYCLKEGDPRFLEESDNVLAQQVISGKSAKKYQASNWGIADGNNHSEYMNREHVMCHEFHCYLYYCLYAVEELDWYSILLIGDIWIDVEVIYQKFTASA